jgi:hypothetical protein
MSKHVRNENNLSTGTERKWSDSRRLVDHFGPIAAKLLNKATGATGQASVQRLVADDVSVTAKFVIGQTSAMIRVFNPDDGLARLAFTRACEVHMATKGLGLLPDVLSTSREHHLLLTEDLSGASVGAGINAATVLDTAQAIGRWLGQFSSATTARPTADTWYGYLSHHYVSDKSSLSACREFLENVPISHESLSASKVRLGSFTRAPNGDVYRSFIPTYAYRPVGWELMNAGSTLAAKMPKQSDEILFALASCWAETYHGDALDPDTIVQLMSVFAALTPAKGFMIRQARSEKYLDAFNSTLRSDAPKAQAAFVAPYNDAKLTPVSKDNITNFRDHIVALQLNDIPTTQKLTTPNERNSAAQAPSENLSALCTICAGLCCSKGGKSFAYLTSKDLAAFSEDHPDLDADGTADFYVAQIPEKHAKGGCLFQGERGCTLSREMRSFTCNNYLCNFAKHVASRPDVAPSDTTPLLFISRKDEQTKKVSLVTDKAITNVEIEPLGL